MLTTTCFSANISLLRTSGSVVEYRLAKARVAGSNPVSCSEDSRKLESFFYCIFGHSRTLGRSGNHRFRVGTGSMAHNKRSFPASNVDAERTEHYICFPLQMEPRKAGDNHSFRNNSRFKL